MSRISKRFLTFNVLFTLTLSLGLLSASFSARDFSTLSLSLYKKFHDDHRRKIAPADKDTIKRGRHIERDGQLRDPSRELSVAARLLEPATGTSRIIFTSQMIFAPRMLAQISQSVLNL